MASLPLFPYSVWRHKNTSGGKTMANCETCKGKEAHAPESVPYIVHESSMARMERQIKRLWIAVIVAVVLLFASSAIFTLAWMQYDYSSEEIVYQQDGEGTNIIGDSNEVDNYGAESDNSEAQTNP